MYIVVDLDGTVYRGDEAIPGAVEALELLAERGHQCVFVTNNSLSPTSAYVKKLERLGVKLEPTQMLTASEALSTRLLDVFGAGAAVYVVGAEALHDEIASAGLRPVEDHRMADVVGLGWDRDFTYAKLDAICAARWDGIPVYATNPDPTCPLVDGQVPDCGALIAAIETATGWPIDEVVGKPSVRMVELALARYGGTTDDCWVVGDRLETDVRMALDCGANSALLLSGATSLAAAEASALKPTIVCDDLSEFARVLTDGAGSQTH
ncbi:HAD-IIA family hydrolase [Phytoactinopolyspora mesophila]|uniref:HAD-IIA family hydrolase n=1 Tax=Phytoactinopolyspora mesophila TaxID=2650750 RepID=A0A7K3M9A6_9ACTN|nr:HAD-IIA family hydrolase [Phytoactinopolyspora mesophila]NDL59542.1 HAD-IIA family hydrolase [Phytoactinopolyspora mesophila]